MTAGPDTYDRIDRFEAVVRGTRRGDLPLRLASSAACISAVLRPDVDVDAINAELDALAAGSPARTFDELRQYVFGQLGFRADPDGAGDIDNSMIGSVLATRRGLPVLIATVTMAIGLRTRVPVLGIGMPFQFLIGDGQQRGFYVDPVSGDPWDNTAARARFALVSGGRLGWDERYLNPVRTTAIVERILRNLEATYRAQRNTHDLALVVSMMARLPSQAHRAPEARRLSHVFN
jgi:regulator of sirC expression with transglutaminase-like and TPR domain